jgi:starvation-inducible DNA-binding protein
MARANKMDKLQLALKTAFASEYSFALKAQNFHWNVEGENFYQYHKLFGKIYNEVYDSIDPFAENIRKVRAYTPASYTRFSMLSAIQDETQILEAPEMCAELLSDSDKMAEIHRLTFQLSEEAGEHGLSDFLAGRQDAFRKHSWMLRATLK